METIVDLKSTLEDLDVEFEVMSIVDIRNITDERQRRIIEGTAEIDERLSEVQDKIAVLNRDIDKLTNHADGIDYATAVMSGIITGMIDAIVVGKWNFANAKADAYEDVNRQVIDFAKKQPDYNEYCRSAIEGKGRPRVKEKDPNRLNTAIEFLEWKFHLPGDGAYSSGNFGIDGSTHRLDDFCHHPTLVGLICSVIVQFTGSTLYVNKFGKSVNIPITVNEYGNFVGTNHVTKMFSGVINWFISCAKAMANRKGHLMSDIATESSLPGSFLSIIKELAATPAIQNKDFQINLARAFKNGIGDGKGQVDLGVFNSLFEGAQNKIDIITENAIMHEIKRQTMPVIINEVLVRASYFIRRLIKELKEKQDVNSIEWKKVIPFNNRTIVRMMTIASGTFTTIDMADAAIHSISKMENPVTFFSNMILYVNFAGVGRIAIAIASDVGMGISRNAKRNQRMMLMNEQITLLNAKIYYKQAGMWIAAENTLKTLEEAYSMVEKTTAILEEEIKDINNSLDHIEKMASAIDEKNPGLIDEINDLLEW